MLGHEAWIKIAHDDLLAAKGLLNLELFSAVAYHAQQSAEKALKAYLVLKRNPAIKTHDLLQLIELCMKFDKDFETIYNPAKHLNPFSTKFRYPSEYDIPDFNDAEAAIKQAQEILNFVIQKTSVKMP